MRDEKRVREPGRCLCIYLEGAPDPCLFHRNEHGTSFFLACVLSEIPRIILLNRSPYLAWTRELPSRALYCTYDTSKDIPSLRKAKSNLSNGTHRGLRRTRKRVRASMLQAKSDLYLAQRSSVF